MNLRPQDLPAALARPLAPLWLVHGNAPLLVLEAADAIRAAARAQGYSERETLIADQSFKWEALALAAGNLSLFGSDRLIDLRIPSGKPGRDGGQALQRHAEQLPPQTVTLITLPEVDWQARKSSWFKALSAAAQCIELKEPERAQLPAWIRSRLVAQQQDASAAALAFIADHVEGNLLAAHQEILKLGLLYPASTLELEQVQAAVLNVARYELDDLRAALLEGDPARCARLLSGLQAEAAAPPLLLWVLSNEIRILARLCEGRDRGQALAGLLRSERVFDRNRQQALGRALERLNYPRLRTALLHAARIDRIVKGLLRGDVWSELLQLCLRLRVRP